MSPSRYWTRIHFSFSSSRRRSLDSFFRSSPEARYPDTSSRHDCGSLRSPMMAHTWSSNTPSLWYALPLGQSRLRQAIQDIISDPREVFRVWRDIHADRANLLGIQAESTNRLAAWAQPVFHLFGELASHIMSRRQARWGTLFGIHNIKDSGATVPPALSSHAENLYREEAVWRRYQAYGLISFVTRPICGCGIALSTQKRRQLERGDPVPCDACHNIVTWKTT
jgi:hypothetical protein